MATKTKEHKDVYARLQSLKDQHARTRMVTRGQAIDDLVRQAAQAGKPVRLITALKNIGKKGERVKLEPGNKVLRHEYVTTEELWQSNERHTQLTKFLRDVVPEAERQTQVYSRELGLKLVELTAAQARVKQLQTEVNDTRGRLSQAEDNLAAVLDSFVLD